MRKLSKFIALSHRDKRLFLEAYMMLGVARFQIRHKSFKHIVAALDHNRHDTSRSQLPANQADTALRIGKFIGMAAGNTVWESACLAQSLAAQRMLMRRNIPGCIYLGATYNSRAEKALQAHAWLKCGDTIVTGKAGHERYKVLSTYSWGTEEQ